jgi:hypothetical protein
MKQRSFRSWIDCARETAEFVAGLAARPVHLADSPFEGVEVISESLTVLARREPSLRDAGDTPLV